MAAQGKTLPTDRTSQVSRGFWLAAATAGALSLAAALLALLGPSAETQAPARPTAAQAAAARNYRIAFFEGKVDVDPSDTVSLNVLVAEYLQRARETGDAADFSRALDAAGRSVAALPSHYPSLIAAASAHNAVHDFGPGLAFADRAVDTRPGPAAGHALRGDALLALGRYDEAGSAYQQALTIEANAGVLSRLAHLAFLEGDILNAEDFWKQAVSRSREQPVETEAWARVELATLHFNRGDLDESAAELRRALRVYPDYVHGLGLRARIAAARGDLDRAIADYEAVVARQPLVEYVAALGDAYMAKRRAQEAERQFALVEAIGVLNEANGVNTDLALAAFYTSHERHLERALVLARNAYESAPGIYAADALAWALLKSGRPREAARYSEEALRLATPDATLLYHAGMVQRALGNRSAALQLLEEAMRVNPYFSVIEGPRASAAIAELRGGAR